jgi:cytochrome c peroxidase
MSRRLVWTLALLAAACTAEAVADVRTAPRGLEGAVLVTSAENPWSAAKAELGKQLFFDPRLSGSGRMSCSSCRPCTTSASSTASTGTAAP